MHDHLVPPRVGLNGSSCTQMREASPFRTCWNLADIVVACQSSKLGSKQTTYSVRKVSILFFHPIYCLHNDSSFYFAVLYLQLTWPNL